MAIDPASPNAGAVLLTARLRVSYGVPYWLAALTAIALAAALGLLSVHIAKRKARLREAAQRRTESMRLMGSLRIWSLGQEESGGHLINLALMNRQDLALAITPEGPLEVIADNDSILDAVARL